MVEIYPEFSSFLSTKLLIVNSFSFAVLCEVVIKILGLFGANDLSKMAFLLLCSLRKLGFGDFALGKTFFLTALRPFIL